MTTQQEVTENMIEGYNEAMEGSATYTDPDPTAGLGPRALEQLRKEYHESTHRRPKGSFKDFAAGWRTALELHGGAIWKTLNRGGS